MTTEKMELKSLSLFVLSIFAVVFVASFASAVTLANWPLTSNAAPINVAANLTAGNLTAGLGISGLTFDATNGSNGTGWNQGAVGPTDYYQVTLTAASGFNFTISTVSFNHISSNPATNMNFDVNWSKDNFATSTSLVSGGVSTTTSALSSINTNIALNGGETLTLRIFGYNSDNSSTETFSVRSLDIQGTTPATTPPEVQACTTTGNPGQLRVKGIDFSNNGMELRTFGKDDEWFPFEEIEVDLEVENNHLTLDVDDISVEWGLWDTKKNQWVIDLDEEDEINLKDGDEQTLTISFKIDDDLDVDLDELSDGDNYRFYVVATGTVDGTVGSVTNPTTCVSDFEQASIVIESDFVVLDNFQVPESVQCGATVDVTADVWNIGDSDQDEVKVDVYDRNREFIDKIFEVGDIDAFDNAELSFSLQIPKDAEEGTYNLILRVLDEDSDLYENDFDDDPAEFSVPLVVSGGCSFASQVSVTANTVSGGREGQELVVRATVANTGQTTRTYTLNVGGSESWASSFSLNPTTVTLAAGQSGDVEVTLDVNDRTAGSQTFFLELVSNGELVSQPVNVQIEKSSGFLGITGAAIGDNWYLWGIGLLNLILVIVIIVVAVRFARR